MSKFFQAGGDDSSSGLSSGDEESLYGSSGSESLDSGSDLSDSGSDNESEAGEGASGGESDADSDSEQAAGQYSRNKFLKGGASDSDSDSEDERVTVKSAKDKALDEVVSSSNQLEANVDGDDWVTALTTFEKLVKIQDKANKLYSTVPSDFVEALTMLQETLREKVDKKLSPSMSKAQNTLKQRVKKVSREYETRLTAYLADPHNYQPGLPSVTETMSAASESSSKDAAGVAAKGPATRTSLNTGAAIDESELSENTVFRTLVSVAESRGRKSTDRHEQITLLERQLEFATTAYQKISILLMLIPLRFDVYSNSNSGSNSMSAGADFGPWEKTEGYIRELLAIIEAQGEYDVYELATEPEDLEKGPQPTEATHGLKLVPGNLATLVERLDDEHARILSTYDPHTTEYMERLRDETRLGELILRAQCHQEATLKKLQIALTDSEAFCRLVGRRIEHIYYKPGVVAAATEAAAWQRVPPQLNTSVGSRVTDAAAIDSVALISELCGVLYKQNNAALRSQAVLGLIYQYALSDNYYRARDLMLMSHMQSQVHSAEPSVQVLFNRALVQVGLCAFRAGLINDSLQSLQEICSSSRLKELVGQGQARQDSGSSSNANQGMNAPELLPYHMHINLELVECVYLTASMLTEIPFLANIAGLRSAQLDLKRRSQNRVFRRMLEQHDRQVFNGPSETTRDYVIQSAKSLQIGDWREAYALLDKITVWNLLSLDPRSRAKTMAMLEHKVKVEGLRTYLLAYGAQAYHTLAIELLQNDFELSREDVMQLVVKMIAGDEISALIDSTSQYVIFRAEADISRLQSLALALADKGVALTERNERLAGDGHMQDQPTKRPIRGRA